MSATITSINEEILDSQVLHPSPGESFGEFYLRILTEREWRNA